MSSPLYLLPGMAEQAGLRPALRVPRRRRACRGQPERFAFSFERMDPLAPLPELAPHCSQAAAAAMQAS